MKINLKLKLLLASFVLIPISLFIYLIVELAEQKFPLIDIVFISFTTLFLCFTAVSLEYLIFQTVSNS